MDAEGLACWVSVDILLLENGRYVVREHRATEDADGMIASDSNGSIIESGAEVRAYCTEHTPDPLRAAVARGGARQRNAPVAAAAQPVGSRAQDAARDSVSGLSARRLL